MSLKGASSQTTRQRGDISVIFIWEMSQGSKGGQTIGPTRSQANADGYAKVRLL